MKRVLILLTILATVMVVLALNFLNIIPPRDLTATRMHLLKRRVLQYAKTHGQLPLTLMVLPEMEGYDNSIRDGWKRNIIFETTTSGVVTFRSLGRDGAIGGATDDTDIIRSFSTHDAQGEWSAEMVEWLEDTFRK